MRLFLLLLCCLQVSCVVVHEKTAAGDSATYASLGGKGAWRKWHGLIHNHEKSFRDGAITAATLAGSYYSAVSAKAKEETARVTAQEVTKRRAAEQVTQQTSIQAREAVTKTALQMEMPIQVTPP